MYFTREISFFIRIFLCKRYALPYIVVVDAVILPLLKMPVLYYQVFLTFVQRYKMDISSEQKLKN
uniref:Uncharacterized protein n=1 Tax=Megaselia scalaris TaxID=36166 RepID=T1GTV3_MEGSC